MNKKAVFLFLIVLLLAAIPLVYAQDTIETITEEMNLTLVVLFLMVFNIALTVVKRPLLSIVVGLFSLAIAALSFQTGYTVIFQGWLQAMLFFVTIVSMLISYKVTR